MKRVLQKFLALMMVLWTSSQLSAYDFHVDGIYYNILSLEDKTVEVCQPYESIQYSGEIIIPEKVSNDGNNYTVVAVGDYAFSGCGVTTVAFPATIERIGNWTFDGCLINDIKLPESLKFIGESAFSRTGLLSISIPLNVVEIGAGAFSECTLESIEVDERNVNFKSENGMLIDMRTNSLVKGSFQARNKTIPDFVERIESYAFGDLGYNSEILILPESLKYIGERAFIGCEFSTVEIPKLVNNLNLAFELCSISYFNVASENEHYSSVDGLLYNKNITKLILSPSDLAQTEITLPETVKVIEDGAFESTKLRSVNFPDGLEVIGNSIFRYTSEIKEITIPSSVKQIGSDNFGWNNEIKKVICKAEIPPILGDDFSHEALVYVPEGSLSAYEAAENWKEFPLVEGDGSQDYVDNFEVDGIYYHVLSFTKHTVEVCKSPDEKSYAGSIVIPVSVETEGITYDVVRLGDGAFSYCSELDEVIVPESVKVIGCWPFMQSGVKRVVLPENAIIENGGNQFFEDCKLLTEVNLPSTLTEMGGMFVGCLSLERITLPEGLNSVNGFGSCASLIEINIPNSVTAIGSGAFYGCSSLKNIILPEGLVSIGGYAFQDCSSLEEINIPANVNSIGADAFKGCTAVKAFNVDKKNQYFTSYEGALFNKEGDILIIAPKGVEVVRVPETTAKIEDGAFEGSETITNVSLPETLTEIGNNAFADCSALQTIEVPGQVTTIGENAFNNCASLATVTLGASVETIGDNAFVGCDALTSMTVLAVVPPAYGQAQEPQNAPVMKAPSRAANDGAFSEVVYQNCKLRVPEESVADYQASLPWRNFRNIEGIEMEKVGLDQTELEMEVGEEITLIATVTPESVEDKTVKWSSSDEDVVTVDEAGKVTAVAAGTAVITAKTVNGVKATCTVTVTEKNVPMTGIELDKTEAEGYIDGTVQLTATVKPEDTTDDTTVTWTSSDEEVATVDENGLVSCLAEGEAVITAKCGEFWAECIVTVTDNNAPFVGITSLTLSETEVELPLNYTYSLFAIIAPENATDTELEWSSSDVNVARVDEGVVYGIVPGEAVITAKTTDGSNLSASCKVTIVETSGIDGIEGDGVKVTAAAGVITVKGAAAGSTVEVYSMSGACVAAKTVESSVEEFPIAASGIYVVRAGGKTFKVAL